MWWLCRLSTAVLPDGTVVHTGSRARKSSAGYDLTRLFIGAEGTLAIITEATLKLHCIPKVSFALRISFPDGVAAAARMAQHTFNSGVSVGRCELLDDHMVRIVNRNSPDGGPWPEQSTLLYELTGYSTESVRDQVRIVQDIAREHGAGLIVTATDDEATRSLWRMRKECLWTAMSAYPDKEGKFRALSGQSVSS